MRGGSTCAGCKWLDKKTQSPAYFYDCAGFVRTAMKQIGLSLKSGATSQYKDTSWQKERGTIANMPKNKICVLYRDKDGTKEHTGIYCPQNHLVYDCRGHEYGVIESTIEKYGKWTHYVVPKNIEENQETEETEMYNAIVTANNGADVNVREAPTTSAKRIAKLPVGTVVEVIEEGIEWHKIKYNNEIGYMMAEFLVKQNDTPITGGDYYVRIRCETKEQAEQLVAAFKTAEIEN